MHVCVVHMYKTEYNSSIDISNKCEYKHPSVLSSQRHITLTFLSKVLRVNSLIKTVRLNLSITG